MLYDLYSAGRNERLKHKHGSYAAGEEEARAMAKGPCVAVELSKWRGAKKAGAPEPLLRRSMPAAAAAEFSQSYRASGSLSAMWSSLRIQIRENSTDGSVHQPDNALGVHDPATTSFHAPTCFGAQIPGTRERRRLLVLPRRRKVSGFCEVLSTNSINCHEFGYKLEIQEEEIEITEGEGGR
ncbi:unnamed protein product [Triticum turgidum subsp. durum]|uniref:Uncharacterized protein n=1 Tax=Triticum turgidum subsp. durum TaxID=4567 RepID=A0A9R1ANH4_TRITD|nr:unnamed protein product [Triticum turgidum subsp. durum]